MDAPTMLVHRLPPETIARVFLWLLPVFSMDRMDEVAPNWSYLHTPAAVCRYWKSTVIGCPQLWTWVEPRGDVSTERLGQLLKRSGNCTLDLFIDLEEVSKDTFRLLATHSGRFKRLSVFLGDHRVRPLLETLELMETTFTEPAPLLEALVVFGHLYRGNGFCSSECILPELFDDEYPNLSMLSLIMLGLPDSLSMKDLTYFHLGEYHDSEEPNLPTVLDLLRTCPRIRVIKLFHSLLSDISPTDTEHVYVPPCPEEELVHLPSLVTCEITSGCREVQQFLSSVVFPSTTRIALMSYYEDAMDSEDIRLKLSFPDRHTHPRPGTSISERPVISYSEEPNGDQPNIDLYRPDPLYWEDIQEDGLEDLKHELRTIDSFYAEKLTVFIVHAVVVDDGSTLWRDLFRSLISLKVLRITSNPTAELFEGLGFNCPHLQDLEIMCSSFTMNALVALKDLCEARRPFRKIAFIELPPDGNPGTLEIAYITMHSINKNTTWQRYGTHVL